MAKLAVGAATVSLCACGAGADLGLDAEDADLSVEELAVELESAQEEAPALAEEGDACFAEFKGCIEGIERGSDAAHACKEELKACLPDGARKGRRGARGDGDKSDRAAKSDRADKGERMKDGRRGKGERRERPELDDETKAVVRACMDEMKLCVGDNERGSAEAKACKEQLRACLPEGVRPPKHRKGKRARRALHRFVDKEALSLCREEAEACIDSDATDANKETCREEAKACARPLFEEAFGALCATAAEKCAAEDAPAKRCEAITARCAEGLPAPR